MATVKKQAPKSEIVREEAATFETPKVKAPIVKAEKSKKVVVDDQLIEAQETERYPRYEQSENYRGEVIAPMTGVPTVRVAPVGWVGPAPLSVPESRIDELIQLLTKLR